MRPKMKKLLLLGGGFLQTYVIKKARELGYYVLVLDVDPHAVGFQYASEYAVINIVDEEGCLNYAREKHIDGVLTAATDFGVVTMSRIATELGLPGINYQSAKLVRDKAAVRRCLSAACVDDTRCSYEISSPEQIPEVLKELKFPVMTKPIDGSGSRGVSRVDSAADFAKACKYALDKSVSHRAFVVPFIEGKEYGVESFVYNGEAHVLGIMRKEMTKPPYYAELGHAMPSGLSEEMERKLKDLTCKALAALNVNHGSVNMDLIIGKSNDVHIVDVGARMGGNLIGSHIISYGAGIDYMANMIRTAVGDPADFSPKQPAVPVASKLLALTPGKVAALPDFKKIAEENDVEIEQHLSVGTVINEYHTNLDGCGYVVAKGKDAEEAIRKAEKAKARIDNEIIRE